MIKEKFLCLFFALVSVHIRCFIGFRHLKQPNQAVLPEKES